MTGSAAEFLMDDRLYYWCCRFLAVLDTSCIRTSVPSSCYSTESIFNLLELVS